MMKQQELTEEQKARLALAADRTAQQYEIWALEWKDRPAISKDYEAIAERHRQEAEKFRKK